MIILTAILKKTCSDAQVPLNAKAWKMQTDKSRQKQEEWSLQREYHGVIQRSRSLSFRAVWAWLVYRRTRGLQCHGGRVASFIFTVNSGRSVWRVRHGRRGAAEARGGREARRALRLPCVSSGVHSQHLHRRKVRKFSCAKKKKPTKVQIFPKYGFVITQAWFLLVLS